VRPRSSRAPSLPALDKRTQRLELRRLAAVIARVGRHVQRRLLQQVRGLAVLGHRHVGAKVRAAALAQQHAQRRTVAVERGRVQYESLATLAYGSDFSQRRLN